MIILEPDSQTAIFLATYGCSDVHPSSPLVGVIRSRMRKDWRAVLHHVLREANTAADLCAAFGYGMALGVHEITIAPPAFWLILGDDIRGVLLPRNFVV